jgi:protein kinase A
MAVKLQSKYQLIKGKQVQHLFNEISIMNKLDHPFILKLNGVAQDKRIVYMFTDFMPCGDLMGILNHFDKLDIEKTVFYAA